MIPILFHEKLPSGSRITLMKFSPSFVILNVLINSPLADTTLSA